MRDTWCYLRANGGGPIFHTTEYNGVGWMRCITCRRQIYRRTNTERWSATKFLIVEHP